MPYADQNGNKVYLIIQLDFGSKKVANSSMQMSRYGFMSHWNLNFIKVKGFLDQEMLDGWANGSVS